MSLSMRARARTPLSRLEPGRILPLELRSWTPTAVAFWLLLAVAVALRAWAVLTYSPAVLTHDVHDGAGYIRGAHYGLAMADQEPSGYPLFLRALHVLSHSLTFAIVTQHTLGIASGILYLLVVRRLGLPTWLGLVPAVVIWFNGDQLFLEHSPLSESWFELILAAALYAAVRAFSGSAGWSLAAGSLAAGLPAIRSVATIIPIVVILLIALALIRSRPSCWRAVAAAAAGALLITAGYGVIRREATGRWSSIVAGGTGWNLYARTAQFADCHRFHPPRGTAMLCQSTPPDQRPGPGYYLWSGGPARAAFGAPDLHDALLEEFAIAAIVHQPAGYLSTVWTDLTRYVDPSIPPVRLDDFAGVQALDFPVRGPTIDPALRAQVLRYYTDFGVPSRGAVRRLWDYQQVFRVTGPILLVLLLLSLAALPSSTGRARWGVALMIACALALLVVPAMTVDAEWRYAIPTLGPLAVAAAAGGWGLFTLLGALATRTRARLQSS